MNVAAFFTPEQQSVIGSAVVALLVAFVGYVINKKANTIHTLVNQRMTDALKRIGTLETLIRGTPGIVVPPDVDGIMPPPIGVSIVNPEPVPVSIVEAKEN